MAGDDSDRDSTRIAAIVDRARATRKPPSRAMWIAAAGVAIACALALVLVLAGEPEAPSRLPRTETTERGWGFGAGLVVGLVAGIAIGIAIARQRHSSRSTP